MGNYVLKGFDEIEAMFNEMAVISSDFFSYNQSYKVSPNDINDMNFYRFDFEPYTSLASSLGLSGFGIKGSGKRFYLTHINIAGHRPLCTVRPVNLEQLKDLSYLDYMLSNYCQNLELDATPIGLHRL
ncbi:hypothetical protein LY624_08615 [Pseudoalteromonas sp. N1230-9]|uniref:hypothetical protein n=1 Tax=Pseudoalteromonas sp. N1230-9 TaxID=2907156 RepID=UPI002B2AB4E0|nr:hypothetical protein LY624_08615 [Pseudoalteromonas sp. N1230-9]